MKKQIMSSVRNGTNAENSGMVAFDYSTPKTLRLKLSGDWRITAGFPAIEDVAAQLADHRDVERLAFDLSGIAKWDTGLVAFLLHLSRMCKRKHVYFVEEGLSSEARRLLETAFAAMNAEILPPRTKEEPFFAMVGSKTVRIDADIVSLLNFLGEVASAFGRLFNGRACFRRDEFFYLAQRCGIDALFLVSLISVLVGMIFTFVGAIQLQVFGAQIYVAHIVGIAMVRVMGAVMAGILMAGRTGASFAAELGIMQTNEEIDALKTLGVNPIDYLVVPRVLVMIVMLPLLTLYADIMGILGGLIISATMLGINPVEYWHHTQMAVKLSNLWVGLVNGLVFGVLIAVAGCFHGMKCERSAAGVGQATTSAVVSAITAIVIATAIITFICQILGIN